MTIEERNKQIDETCEMLLDAAKVISELQPVSHLSKSYVQFSGGILGGIQEYREGKRLEKLMNTVIYKGISFYEFGFGLIDTAKDLVEQQLEIQKSVPKSDERYYGNVVRIIQSVTAAYTAWFNYSPDMADAGIKVGEKDNVSIALSARTFTKQEFRKMDLPEGVTIEEEKQQSDNSGCIGILLIIIVPISALFFLMF